MRDLEKNILAIMLGKQVDEAKKPLHPNQQKLDVHEPEKDELTSKDFEMLRAGKKAKMKEEVKVLPDDEEEMDDEEDDDEEDKKKKKMDEMSKSMAYATGTKKAMQMTGDQPPLEKSTIKKAHSIAKAMLRKEEAEQIVSESGLELDPLHPKNLANTGLGMSLKTKIKRRLGHDEYGDIRARQGGPRSLHYGKKPRLPEEAEQFIDYDELIETKPFEYEVQENYNFGDYLKTAKQLVGEEEAINLANEAFNAKDTDLFLEAVGRADIEAKVKMHSAAGHKVSTPKYSTKGGEFHAEYVVTDKESGIRRKYIHHGSSRKVENMGAAGKRD